jgi:hypothetical protein
MARGTWVEKMLLALALSIGVLLCLGALLMIIIVPAA